MPDINISGAIRLPKAVAKPKPASSPCAACTIRDLAVCSALEGTELDRLNAIRMPAQMTGGGTLFDEGATADYVYNLTVGTMKLYRLLPDGRRQITGFVYPGDFLGLANNGERAYTAEALSDISLCKFKRGQLENLFNEFPKLKDRFLGISRDELVAAQAQMLLLGRKTARERIASFIIATIERAELMGLPTSPIEVPMSRNDIGDYLGLTTETVSRTLTRLKQTKMISLPANKQIGIIDRDGLTKIAEGF